MSSNLSGVQLNLVKALDRLGRLGDMRDDSAEVIFQSFLQEALVSSSGTGTAVHSLVFPRLSGSVP